MDNAKYLSVNLGETMNNYKVYFLTAGGFALVWDSCTKTLTSNFILIMNAGGMTNSCNETWPSAIMRLCCEYRLNCAK